ncbi:MAG TPA: sarcosine oxidase subunit gamma family protein [Arenicellales bacterium]|nr:sarcosine oxidase subunit gamma family protein [Arenicellales bacterium]
MPDASEFSPVRAGPLVNLPAPAGGIALEERPLLGKLNLRGEADNEAFAAAVRDVLGCALPTVPNSVAVSEACTVFWLGPDEWLIHCADDARPGLEEKLKSALADQHSALVDVSDYYVVMRLSGSRVFEVLAKAVPLDLHPRAFHEGCCAQTRFGHASVLLHKLSEDTADLQVRWSFAEYVWLFLVDGAREYQ